ncbi:hypothetical protein G6F35_014591 [Rhizopus arrhizus]|nr:hypothetical protein G6F35_014591 [Rhizopus arrhizus]
MFEALSAGLFNGLIYAAVAVGLALIWGITDVINFAHGEFLMLGMYAAYWLYTLGHIDPTMAAHGGHPGHLRPWAGVAPARFHRLFPRLSQPARHAGVRQRDGGGHFTGPPAGGHGPDRAGRRGGVVRAGVSHAVGACPAGGGGRPPGGGPARPLAWPAPC